MGLFTNLPRVIVAWEFSPSSFKLKKEASYLPWQNKYPNLKTTCHVKLKFSLRAKLPENLILAKYLISITAGLIFDWMLWRRSKGADIIKRFTFSFRCCLYLYCLISCKIFLTWPNLKMKVLLILKSKTKQKFSRGFNFANWQPVDFSRGFNFANLVKISENC